MKGILMAGGVGSRLFPTTFGVSKQLLPIYDKPMVYYPLSILMLGNIRHILVLSTPDEVDLYGRLLGDGSQWGIQLDYAVQSSPKGIAHGLIVAQEFIGDESICMVLGDNVFYGPNLGYHLLDAQELIEHKNMATIFGYSVNDPSAYGVISFDENNRAVSIDEKPSNPTSKVAVAGLYFYPNSALEVAKSIVPSERGELEITSINNYYLDKQQLNVVQLKRGFAWLDTGSHDSLLEASQFISTIEKRQGVKVACLEEIAFEKQWITKSQVLDLAESMSLTPYGQYLLNRFK